MNTSKGITPVIAIVLLLMMTVGAVGGAYAWFSGIMQDAQEDANTQQNTEINMYNTECTEIGNQFHAIFWIENTGDRAVDFSAVDVLVFDRANDERVVSLGSREKDLTSVSTSERPNEWSSSEFDSTASEPNMVAGYNLSLGSDPDTGLYEVELRFTNTEVSVTADCQVQ